MNGLGWMDLQMGLNIEQSDIDIDIDIGIDIDIDIGVADQRKSCKESDWNDWGYVGEDADRRRQNLQQRQI